MNRKVLIVGAGISGLATAEAIIRRSTAAGAPVDVELLEAASVPGGKIRSSVDNGFVVETGPHGFLDKEPKMFQLIDRLGLRDEMIPADLSSARRFIVRAEKMRELPSSPASFLWSDILPLTGKLRMAMEPFAGGPPTDVEESVWEFAARRIGRQAADVLVDAMVTGIYGGDPKVLSLRAAFPRMFELETAHGSLIRAQMAVSRERRRQKQLAAPGIPVPKQTTGAPAGTLHSFRRGLGTLTDALAANLKIHYDHAVDRVERLNGTAGAGGEFELKTSQGAMAADAVVLTAPCRQMIDMMGHWNEGMATALSEIPYAAVHVVVHAFRAKAVPQGRLHGFGFLIPGTEERDLLGSIWASSVFPPHVPEGTVMFRSMVGGYRRPDLGAASDETLIDRVRAELSEFCGLDPKEEPLLQRVIRWDEAIPQYTQGHLERVAAADRFQAEYPGLYLSGNGLRGVAMLNCVAEGDRVAEQVLAGISS